MNDKITQTTDPTLSVSPNDKANNLEVYTDAPNISLLMRELQQAQTDVNLYYNRNAAAYDTWNSRWAGQTADGLKHGQEGGPMPFPWENSSDTRLRTVDDQIRDHVLVSEFAFDSARIQARALRPFAASEGQQSGVGGQMGGAAGAGAAGGGQQGGGGTQGRESNKVSQLLKWMIYTHMAAEVQREIPLAFAWKFGYGASALAVEWDTARRLDFHEISIPMLDDLIQATGGSPMMIHLMEAIRNPAQEENMAELVQSFSPIVTKAQARKIVRDLREVGYSEIPVPTVLYSKPRITALRIGVDILFPAYCSELRQEPPWVDRKERVTETELRDRIKTQNYDPQFVEEACKHKGKTTDAQSGSWIDRTMAERSSYAGYGYGVTPNYLTSGPADSHRNLIELHHFIYKAIDYGVPCLYRTVFNPDAIGKDSKAPLYATHGPFEYDHGEYPYQELVFERNARSILSSRGIPEIAYTWENELKVQADGLTDRTAIVLRPPMIVPHSRVNAIKGQPIPGAVLGVTRPQEVNWMQLPPTDATPIEVQNSVMARVQNYFGLFGETVDPDKKQLRRKRLGKQTTDTLNLVFDQVFKLMQQYLPDQDVAATVGAMSRPFKVGRQEIQGAHEISVSVDMGMVDAEYMAQKIELIGKVMPFNQAGTADMASLFQAAMQIIDPDLADMTVQDTQTATEKEKMDEMNAIALAFTGQEPPFPQFGNHQLRLQTLMQNVFQSPNPQMPTRLAQNPDTKAILVNRAKMLQAQIQQHQQNPQIGRMLGQSALQPGQAPQAALPMGS